MTAIKNMVIGVLYGLAFVGSIVGLVLFLKYLGFDATRQIPSHEVEFRAVCDRLHGTTVWNGKQLECLK